MGLKLDEEEMFDAKLDSLDETSREKATFYKAQIVGKFVVLNFCPQFWNTLLTHSSSAQIYDHK